MRKLQFRVLYRQFLFRVVELELLSPGGDMSKLLGQFAALLVFFGLMLSFGAFGIGDNRLPREALMISAWSFEHALISSTMLVVGLFAVLSWDSSFPDRRDVLVLAPLPVHAHTLFLAKVAAVATALSLTVAALNALSGIVLPFVFLPPNSNLLDMVFSLGLYRSFAAYWTTMLCAGLFIFCSVLGVQGLAAYALPRRAFLRLSAFLQMAAFCLFVTVYFMQPALAAPAALSAPGNQRLLAWLPSYWFLGVFQQLNGSIDESVRPMILALARRAWTGLAIAVGASCTAFLLSYFRTMRKIIEEPDIMPGSRLLNWPPRFGNSLQTAVVQFSIRALLRSRQHRVMLAFYLGIGFAIVLLFMKTPRAQHLNSANTLPLFSSLVIMCVWVVGTRVVFSMPIALSANWIFRLTEVRGPREYPAAIRRPLFVLAVAPVWLGSAMLFFAIWPWRQAAGHLAILALWGMMLAYASLYGFRKIPFTCSYLPGKSFFHMAFLGALGLLLLLVKGVDFESRALYDSASYIKMLMVVAGAAILAQWLTVTQAKSDETIVQFEELAPPALLSLGLHRDGSISYFPSQNRPSDPTPKRE